MIIFDFFGDAETSFWFEGCILFNSDSKVPLYRTGGSNRTVFVESWNNWSNSSETKFRILSVLNKSNHPKQHEILTVANLNK